MDCKFITINDFQILLNNDNAYMSLKDISLLFKCDFNALKNDFDKRTSDDETDRISHLNETYYSLDLIISSSFDYDYKEAFKLYESSLKKGIVFKESVKKTMSEAKTFFEKMNLVIEDNQDLVKTFYKLEDTGNELDVYGNPGYISLENLQILIGLLKDKYDFGEDFGIIRDYSTLVDILYFVNSASFIGKDEEIDIGKDDDIAYIVKTIYNIVKKKPFVKGNETIAAFIAYYYLEQAELEKDEDSKVTTCNDIALAVGLIINSNDNNVIETLKKAKSLLAKHYALSDSQTTYELTPITDTSKEGIMNYIISSIENFHGYQGYYDYFKGKSYVYKIHYHGFYNEFSLNKAKTFISNNTLFFKGVLHCFSEAPNGLTDRDSFLEGIVEEIKIRSYNDVITPFLKKLKAKVKPYFDLNSIDIKFDFEIKTKFSENYDL